MMNIISAVKSVSGTHTAQRDSPTTLQSASQVASLVLPTIPDAYQRQPQSGPLMMNGEATSVANGEAPLDEVQANTDCQPNMQGASQTHPSTNSILLSTNNDWPRAIHGTEIEQVELPNIVFLQAAVGPQPAFLDKEAGTAVMASMGFF